MSMLTNIMRIGNHHEDDSKILYKRSYLFYLQDNFQQAIKHLQQLLRGDPDNEECKEMLKKIKKLDKFKSEGNEAFKCGNVYIYYYYHYYYYNLFIYLVSKSN